MSSICVQVCMCVNFFLSMCSMIACVRLKLDLGGGGGYNFKIRCVNTEGAKLKRYGLLHRGEGDTNDKLRNFWTTPF